MEGPMKLGILLWSQGSDWRPFRDAARRMESLGYDYLWTWDHVYAIFGDPHQAIFEGWTALAGLAASTERLRLGLMVGANTFRNPALVAKMAATNSSTSFIASSNCRCLGGACVPIVGPKGPRNPNWKL